MWRISLSGSIFPPFDNLTVAREPPLELPTQHRIPLTWLLNHAGESIRYRTLVELVPGGSADPAQVQAALDAIVQSKPALAVVKRQKETGVWGGNLLGLAPSAKTGP